jgi:UDP-N-acetyl-alpha-D-muramoyl-L-alanyl-L-glutamate epimerase
MINFREKYPEFTYSAFDVVYNGSDLTIEYTFEIAPDFIFHPKLTITHVPQNTIPDKQLRLLAFNLGMVEMLSYWKTTCTPLINITAMELTPEQIDWWKDLLIKGMGEYFYKNNINFTAPDFVNLKSTGEKFPPKYISENKNKVLIPVGGGKDSAVTLDFIKLQNQPFGVMLLNPTQAALSMTEIASPQETIIINRVLDPLLLKLNSDGFYNGHTPFSAYLAFLGVLVGGIFGYDSVALSNERSSNEATTEFLGQEINHQYSKSFEFENKFREYCDQHLTNINYYSLLRPLFELEIAKLFTKLPKYFEIFRSCNQGAKSGVWCGKCPKCLSTFILLAPFLNETQLKAIFTNDLFTDLSLYPLLEQMAIVGKVRPFECVGGQEETIIGLYLATQKYAGVKLPELLEKAQTQILTHENNLEIRAQQILTAWDTNNNIPEKLSELLKKYI